MHKYPKSLAVLLALPALSGCAGFTAYVQQHAAGIAAFSVVAGAVASAEGAVVGAITIEEKGTGGGK